MIIDYFQKHETLQKNTLSQSQVTKNFKGLSGSINLTKST